MTPREAIAKLRSLGFEVEAPPEIPGYVFVGWAGRPDAEPAVPVDILDVWAAQREGVYDELRSEAEFYAVLGPDFPPPGAVAQSDDWKLPRSL